MERGLFKSIYGRPGEGLFRDGFNMGGQKQPSSIQSQNIRLGEAGQINQVFESNLLGIPVWLVAVSLLGFAFVFRRKTR